MKFSLDSPTQAQPKSRPALAAIGEDDLPTAAEFLSLHLNHRVAKSTWIRAFTPQWDPPQPNHGFMLRDNNEVVGVHMAIYSERTIRDRAERFCNLAAWCVLPAYRADGLRLIRALLAQPEYHFTDLSPSGNVIALNRRLGFRELPSNTALVLNLPVPTRQRIRVLERTAEIRNVLSPADQQLYVDHQSASAAIQLVMKTNGGYCYVIARRDRRKSLDLFASILHVSNTQIWSRSFRHILWHLLVRHGIVATLIDQRIAPVPRAGSLLLAHPRVKMFRSTAINADDVDYLYSELTCVPW